MSVFVIAEIGINHNGSLDLCKKLIDVAVEAGCNAVKFQKRSVEKVYSPEYLDSYRESPWGTTQRAQKSGLEFCEDDYFAIDDYCNTKSISWFASAWDLDSQLFLRKFNCKFNKIASPLLTYQELLKMVASEGRHTIISTGMSTLAQIDTAVSIFRSEGCSFELMHAVSTYPMQEKDANLMCIQTLRDRYMCDVGYSGHESGLAITLGAVAVGASSVERHITLDRAMYGSDQSASLEPSGLRQLLGGIRKLEVALGDGVKRIVPDEELIMSKLRPSH